MVVVLLYFYVEVKNGLGIAQPEEYQQFKPRRNKFLGKRPLPLPTWVVFPVFNLVKSFCQKNKFSLRKCFHYVIHY